ncbi:MULTISPECIES: GntR family transcriptional regulator [Enterococcus]|uniref:HTH gntR-type domain-containing protein n=1 Tax=Enterococcus mundtii TaxID=53346 RepID=A0A2S7RX91_ENTMU|nr:MULTISPECIES: GntR family transcriptional regulator [Enterococcus]PQF24659.1 hypothetical protein CUS89_03680 [Enterococcus mundtii]PWF37769.1 GntR family transcriptional regulator [Enterococcus faecium]
MAYKNLYIQVKEWILEKIQDGTFKTGAVIPSETELVSMFGVSRATVNKALSDLVHEGFLKRIQGKGTFVQKDKRVPRTKQGSLGFSDEMAKKGRDVKTKPLKIEIIQDKSIASILNVNANAQLIKYERVRVSEGIIIAYQISYVPNKFLLVDKNITVEDLPTIELYELFASNGYEVSRAEEIYTIDRVKDPKVITAMNLEYEEPVFKVKRWSYLHDDTVLEYVESYLKWDYYQIELELHD